MGQNDDSPSLASRFARGDTVKAKNGMNAQIGKLLDFIVVANPAQGLGAARNHTRSRPLRGLPRSSRHLYRELDAPRESDRHAYVQLTIHFLKASESGPATNVKGPLGAVVDELEKNVHFGGYRLLETAMPSTHRDGKRRLMASFQEEKLSSLNT